MMTRLFALLFAVVTLAACSEPEPEYTHEVKSRNGEYVVRYDCGDLEGDTLQAALTSSHNYFERNTMPVIRSLTAMLEEAGKPNSSITSRQLLDELDRFGAAMDRMQAYTDSTGCSFVRRLAA